MLFTTEMWERFSFYTMQALLVLYATAKLADGGLGMGTKEAVELYGYYAAAVYISPLLGGYCADRLLGLQRSVVIGGGLMCIGHFLMIFHTNPTFLSALALVALGSGFFKPCITTLLGSLYGDDLNRRDAGYSIFYMGINIGAFMAGIIGGWLQVGYGFHYAFAAAGIGMVVGQMVFMWGRRRHLGELGLHPHKEDANETAKPLSRLEKKRVWALVALCVFQLFFFLGYWQMGGAMTLYVDLYTDRSIMGWEMPTAWYFSFNPLYIIICCPLVAALWNRLGDISTISLDIRKMVAGLALTAASFWVLSYSAANAGTEPGTKGSLLTLLFATLLLTIGEYCSVPVMLSLVSKISPKAYVSRLMSLALVSIGVAGIISGKIGGRLEELGPHEIFETLALLMTGFTLALMAACRKLESWCAIGVVEDSDADKPEEVAVAS